MWMILRMAGSVISGKSSLKAGKTVFRLPENGWDGLGSEAAVRQRGQAAAYRLQFFKIEIGAQHAFAFGQAGDDVAPGVDNHAVAVGAPAVVVAAALRGGEQIALVFDGAGAQQQLPMGAAGGVGGARNNSGKRKS